MQLQTSIKKVTTTKKDEEIDAQVVFEFIVTTQTLPQLMDLLELQGEVVTLHVEKVQLSLLERKEAGLHIFDQYS